MKSEFKTPGSHWTKCRCFIQSFLLVFALLLSPVQRAWGASCSTAQHGHPSDAEKALAAGDYVKAEILFRNALTARPEDTAASVGLVHTLLLAQKVSDADEAVNAALDAANTSKPSSPAAHLAAMLTAKGEVLLREGKPWEVEKIVLDSYKLDPCNPQTRLLFAEFAEVNSRYATARQQIGLAHQFDPEDAEIRAAWIKTLPLSQRISEMESFLAAQQGGDPTSLQRMKSRLDLWKKQTTEPARACQLISSETSAEFPFIKLNGYAGHSRASGLEMTLNATPVRLQLGAGQGGLTVYRPVAERAGLKRLSDPMPGAFPGAKPAYTAYADSIKLGNLEFHNCTVNVIDSSSPFDDGDGNLDIDVFSDYLLTVDYPMRKLSLAPLPTPPSQASALPTSLHTDRNEDPEIANPRATDRFIAPAIKDYTQFYRAGRSLILPAVLTGEKAKDPATAPIKLFILDVGTLETNVSFGAAFDVSKIHEQNAAFGDGKIKVADEISYNFAHMEQKVNGVVIADTSIASKNSGMEISGFFGANTFKLLIMHVDYRDGLLKFEYIPNRGYKFE